MNTTAEPLKKTLCNVTLAPNVHLYACTYRHRDEVKPDSEQTEFFAENDQRRFNNEVLKVAQILYKVGDKFYPSDLRLLAPSLNPAKPRTMWGPAFQHILHNGFALTMVFRVSKRKSLRGCREFQYVRTR